VGVVDGIKAAIATTELPQKLVDLHCFILGLGGLRRVRSIKVVAERRHVTIRSLGNIYIYIYIYIYLYANPPDALLLDFRCEEKRQQCYFEGS
jgi:hypothetical protein